MLRYKVISILLRNRGSTIENEFSVVINVVLQRKVPVRAKSKDDAEYIVEQQYYNQEHILNENDLTAQSFKAKSA